MTVYAKQVDFFDVNTIYVGYATPGTITSIAAWKITKFVFNPASLNDISQTWADGDGNFDNVWNDHTSLSYS
jgi:hypothetical protein